jgi:thiol-disulfide isomerase/thioredoxin
VTVVDLVVCRHERSFHGSARNLLIVWVAFYASWMHTCKAVGGTYPYPFFDKWATEKCVAVLVGATVVMVGFFYVGKALKLTLLRAVKPKRATRAKKA